MAPSAKDKAAKDKAAKETAAKAKEREKAAKAKEREKAAKAKERAAAAKAKEKAAKAKAKEKAAKLKEREKAAKAKEREKAAKAKEREKAAKAKKREKAAKAKEREKAAKAKERETAKPAARDKPAARARPATPAPELVQPVEEVAVPEQGDAEPVPAEVREGALTALDVPANDKTVRPKGYLAEALGKEDAVGRETQRATLAASYTTRDHDLIRAWAETRGGRPADVAGTGGRRRGAGTAGVLRIEFPYGPGDDSRLEDIDWAPFFSTFDESDVDFLYQERVRTGDVSRFHKIVRASA